ncbi:MAG: ABC transporter permease [Actinobacteria bacterium]|nr:ABC transporter permease [Actinomycetota bacterium]
MSFDNNLRPGQGSSDSFDDLPVTSDPEVLPGAQSTIGGGGAQGRGEGVGELKEVEGLSQSQLVWRRFIRHKGAIFGIVMLALIAALSLSAMGVFGMPGWWKYQNYASSHDIVNGAAPTMTLPKWLGGPGFAIGDHPFGQDNIGRDNFALVMKGAQTSLLVMVVLGLITLILGTTVGAFAGYYRGKVDTVLMRTTDLVITLPVLVLGAVLGKLLATLPVKLDASQEVKEAIVANTPLLLAVVLGFILWPGLARLVRSEFLTLREREFVDSARVAGATDWRIITKHVLPNAVGVIIVNTTLVMSQAVVLEAALSFLGFGVVDPNVSLGKLISDYQGAFATRPWLFWWPGLFIILIALSVNFIGDGLRDAFDPRTKRIPSKREMDKALARITATPATESEGAR